MPASAAPPRPGTPRPGTSAGAPGAPERAPRTGGADDGLTLMEVLVTLGVMTIVMALFGAGLTQLYRTAQRSESLGVAQTQLHQAFLRLDRDIRYASGISLPGTAGGDSYVEYVISNTEVVRCTQLRLSASGLLQSRFRRDSGPVSGWQTLASHVTTPRAFTRTLASEAGAPHQQLGVTLTLSAGAGATASRRQASFTFTALNTGVGTASDGVCPSLGRP
ncbi:PulJ/GspJ family protein [Spirilliplanes yamanashiensis]|uniref:Prepilin-type N-terminal cleavage/methylation domain-containing protein n=1 Tax=Spirilliplanes yamanashiensis TaxID=42233 RepID=A0A8J4DKG8_9ACTN|nr:hypothetical protein [Spirilliplanes yamanashiensis]MDP9818061.1 type II secretory pathway component PulJ [Spirilliplanes yamanashiensis]GIJ04871.1 hypothetical protein Sya03_42230 [Spirilliplanes yamanashiensis]